MRSAIPRLSARRLQEEREVPQRVTPAPLLANTVADGDCLCQSSPRLAWLGTRIENLRMPDQRRCQEVVLIHLPG